MKRKGIFMKRKAWYLAIIMLWAVTFVSACGKNNTQMPETNQNIEVGTEIEPLPVVNPRTEEEIRVTGVVAQDVLDQLDIIALNIYKYPNWDDKEEYGEKWDRFVGSFINIKPNILAQIEPGENVYYPFYAYDEGYTPDHTWFEKDEFLEQEKESIDSVYLISIEYVIGLEDRGLYFTHSFICVPKEDFIQIMEAFDVEKTYLDFENRKNYENYKFINTLYYGQEVYAPFNINREVIENATQEQLDALYKAIMNSIIPINFS